MKLSLKREWFESHIPNENYEVGVGTNLDNSRQCYTIIAEYYGDRLAKRSGVPYINHIDEGLIILEAINATQVAKDAYCLHPILQDDDSLKENIALIENLDVRIVVTAMEYRNVANRGLSSFKIDDPSKIYLGPLKDVHDMLIADKVQNRKDFLKYHAGVHQKSKELDEYFKNWLQALSVTEKQYDYFISLIDFNKN